jgi:hypothetical protein
MCVRDGLPILELSHDGAVEGYLFRFNAKESAEEAYKQISAYVPAGTNSWEERTIEASGIRFNCVVRIPPKPVNEYIGQYEPIKSWSAKDDPLFSKAIHTVASGVKKYRDLRFEKDEAGRFDWESYYDLQMKYLLLWSILERFMSLKVGLDVRYDHHGQMNVRQIFAKDHKPFSDACTKYINEEMKITSFSDPDRFSLLKPDDPYRSIEFFHRIRTNLIHRGKSAEYDGERLRKSFLMLCSIVREILSKESLFRG